METAPAAKRLITTTEVYKMMPGQGRCMFQKLIRARWIAPAVAGSQPIYRTADVLDCLRRLEGGEEPRAVYIWRTSVGADSSKNVAHLVLPSAPKMSACGYQCDFLPLEAKTKCPRCLGKAKYLRVEDA